MKKVSACVFAALGLTVGFAHGQVLYATDFEQPDWTPGPVYGQAGWNVFGLPGPTGAERISDERAYAGGQSARLDSTLLAFGAHSGTGRYLDFDPIASGRPVVRLSCHVFVEAGTGADEGFGVALLAGRDPAPWDLVAVAAISQSGRIVVLSRDARMHYTSAFAPLGAWVNLELAYDVPARTFDVSVDGEVVLTDLPVIAGLDEYLRGVMLVQYTTQLGDSVGYIDSLTVEANAAGCYADCDGSGELDFFDFLCFQSSFAAAEPGADCDQSGSLDFFDFLCFQNAFAAGCP